MIHVHIHRTTKDASPKSDDVERPIIEWPLDSEGYFACPTQQLKPQQEVEIGIRANFAAAAAHLAGPPNRGDLATYDRTGAYLCGGRGTGLPQSSPCNKFKIQDSTCLIRITPKIEYPGLSSCELWDQRRACDIEPHRPGKSGLSDDDIGFAVTKNPMGWGCVRCEHGQQRIPVADSEGRTDWCRFHGITILPTECCNNNTPIKG